MQSARKIPGVACVCISSPKLISHHIFGIFGFSKQPLFSITQNRTGFSRRRGVCVSRAKAVLLEPGFLSSIYCGIRGISSRIERQIVLFFFSVCMFSRPIAKCVYYFRVWRGTTQTQNGVSTISSTFAIWEWMNECVCNPCICWTSVWIKKKTYICL